MHYQTKNGTPQSLYLHEIEFNQIFRVMWT